MTDKIDQTAKNIADQLGPYAVPCATGISPDVRTDRAKLGPELREGIKDFLKRKQT